MDQVTAERRAPFGGSPEVGERGRRTQQQILAAALEIFDEVGYRSARIDLITARAGCSRPTFYQYFASKEALFNRLGGLLGTSLVALTDDFPALSPGSPLPDELRSWTGQLVALHDRWAPAFAAFRPALRGDPQLMAGAADLTRQYGKSLAGAAPTAGLVGGGADVEPEVVAALTMTMLTGALTLRSSGAARPSGPGDDADSLAGQLSEMVYSALVGSTSLRWESGGVSAETGTAGPSPATPAMVNRARHDTGRVRDDPVTAVGGSGAHQLAGEGGGRESATAAAGHGGHQVSGGDGGSESAPGVGVQEGGSTGENVSPSDAVEVALEAAALAVFPRLGVEGTRVDDLVAEAGVGHGTFYRYFTDKAELFERVAGRAATAMYELLADLPLALDAGRVDGWTRRWFATYLEHGAILSVWAETPQSEEKFSEAAAAVALDLLSPATEGDRAHGSIGVLGILSLVEWSPYLVQQFDGFELEPTRRAVAVLLDRLLGPIEHGSMA